MKLLQCTLLAFLLLGTSACGTGKFFIERAVTNMESDIEDEINDFARFDETQRREIALIASQSANWVKTDRLRLVGGELYNIAADIERGAGISRPTWDTTVAFIEQPLSMSSVAGLVDRISRLVFGMTERQASSMLKQMRKSHAKEAEEYAKESLQEQNKKFLRGLKIVFAEMDIKRNKQQLEKARGMLAARQSHIEIEWQEEQRNHATFVELVSNRSGSMVDYQHVLPRLGAMLRKAQISCSRDLGTQRGCCISSYELPTQRSHTSATAARSAQHPRIR